MIPVIYKRLIQIGKISGTISFLVAAPYALYQYIQARDANRVEQTISLFKQYNSPPFIDYRAKLSKALIDNKAQIVASATNEKEFENVQLRILRERDLEADLHLLFDFFDSVTVCVTSKICDDDASIKLFRPRALDIYLNFYQYMRLQRSQYSSQDFGSGLEAIARSGSR